MAFFEFKSLFAGLFRVPDWCCWTCVGLVSPQPCLTSSTHGI